VKEKIFQLSIFDFKNTRAFFITEAKIPFDWFVLIPSGPTVQIPRHADELFTLGDLNAYLTSAMAVPGKPNECNRVLKISRWLGKNYGTRL